MFDKKSYMKQWRKDNKEHKREYDKQWLKDHPKYMDQYRDKYKEYMKKYYIENREQMLERHKQYKIENPENIKEIRRRSKSKRRCLGFNLLNKYFKDSEAHHINKDDVIYIPKELHRNIRHCLETNRNMGEINNIAMSYILI